MKAVEGVEFIELQGKRVKRLRVEYLEFRALGKRWTFGQREGGGARGEEVVKKKIRRVTCSAPKGFRWFFFFFLGGGGFWDGVAYVVCVG